MDNLFDVCYYYVNWVGMLDRELLIIINQMVLVQILQAETVNAFESYCLITFVGFIENPGPIENVLLHSMGDLFVLGDQVILHFLDCKSFKFGDIEVLRAVESCVGKLHFIIDALNPIAG